MNDIEGGESVDSLIETYFDDKIDDGGERKEELRKGLEVVIGSEEEKMHVKEEVNCEENVADESINEMEISSSNSRKMNGQELGLILDCEKKEDLTKVSNVDIGDDKERDPIREEGNHKKNVNDIRDTVEKNTIENVDVDDRGGEKETNPVEIEVNAEKNVNNIGCEEENDRTVDKVNNNENVNDNGDEEETDPMVKVVNNEQTVNNEEMEDEEEMDPIEEEVNNEEHRDSIGDEEEMISIEEEVTDEDFIEEEESDEDSIEEENQKLLKVSDVAVGGEKRKAAANKMVNNVENKNEATAVKDKKEVKNKNEGRANSKNNVGNLRERRRGKKEGQQMKIASSVMKGETAKNTNGQESSEKGKIKQAKDMDGMIFMCSSKTKKDCYHYKVLGLPASKRDIVLKISAGMKLFLFDFDTKLMYGIYKAAGPGGYNIEPKAFKSAFPSQVRFNVYEDCTPLPEEKFRKVIKDNYYRKNKFNFQLTVDQVKNLCKLFQTGSRLKQLQRSNKEAETSRRETHALVDREKMKKRNPKPVTHKSMNQDRTRKRRWGEERNPMKQNPKPVTHKSMDQDRTRKRCREEERNPMKRNPKPVTHKSMDQDRTRKRRREEEKHPVSSRDQLHRDTRDVYGRKAYASPIATRYLGPPLPLPSASALPPPISSYESGLEIDPFRRDLQFEHRNRQFLNLELRRREQIEHRRDLLQDHHDRWYLDTELRRQEEIQHSDLHFLQRNRSLYTDRFHAPALSSDYHSHGGLSLNGMASQSEHWPRRPVYRL